MEHPPSSPAEVSHPDNELFDNLKDLIDTLLNEKSEPLLGLEDDDEAAHIVTGERREINLKKGTAVVARYTEEEQDYMGQILQNAGLNIEKPYGHIEVGLDKPEASFDATLYLSADGRVQGMARCSVVDEDAKLLDDSRDCFEYAEQLGLQLFWSEMLFKEGRTVRLPFELNDRQVFDLTESLQDAT